MYGRRSKGSDLLEFGKETAARHLTAHHAVTATHTTMNVSQTLRSRKPSCRYNHPGIVKTAYKAAAMAPVVKSLRRRTIANSNSVVTPEARISIHATAAGVHPNIRNPARYVK